MSSFYNQNAINSFNAQNFGRYTRDAGVVIINLEPTIHYPHVIPIYPFPIIYNQQPCYRTIYFDGGLNQNYFRRY